MYIQVTNVKCIFENRNDTQPIGAEIEYRVILSESQNVPPFILTKDSVIDIPKDELTGKMVLLDPSCKPIIERSMFDFQRYIHEMIVTDIKQ